MSAVFLCGVFWYPLRIGYRRCGICNWNSVEALTNGLPCHGDRDALRELREF